MPREAFDVILLWIRQKPDREENLRIWMLSIWIKMCIGIQYPDFRFFNSNIGRRDPSFALARARLLDFHIHNNHHSCQRTFIIEQPEIIIRRRLIRSIDDASISQKNSNPPNLHHRLFNFRAAAIHSNLQSLHWQPSFCAHKIKSLDQQQINLRCDSQSSS